MVINGQSLFELAPIKNMYRDKQYAHGVSYGMSEAGYDIRIKQNIQFGHHIKCGLNETSVHDTIYCGNFCIASAIEQFDMSPHLMAIVHDKSTWARRGVSVLNTVIEPGWKGFLTLELVHHGRGYLTIPAGSGIAQVVFHQVMHPVTYYGRYQNQADMPVPAIEAD